jgi:hypothetical protein
MTRKHIRLVLLLVVALCITSAFADINAITPSTNDINRTNGWAHVNVLDVGLGYIQLEFVSTRGFLSCFEYRTDGDTSQKTSDTNYNTDITDGLYPFYCQNNNSSIHTFNANEYIEVRMVFGAEKDERFDWTRFDVFQCKTIQDGTITYSEGHYLAGEPLMIGYDPYGYNYQGHMFKGSYFNSYAGGAGFPSYDGDDEAYLGENPTAADHWAWPYRDVQLLMKWNDAWLSNTDCDGDNKLDRHYGFDSYIGSGAWLTNHQSGEYVEDGKNKTIKWNYFVKIVAAPADAYVADDVWYEADGTEIGEVIWGSFAIIQQVENDPGAGLHGAQYISPAGPGFGQYAP